MRVLQHPAASLPPLPLGAPARANDVLFGLHLADGTLDATRLALTDWSARLASDFGAINSALIWLASNTAKQIERAAQTEYFAANGLYHACVAVKAEVSAWRREVVEMAVSL